MKKITALSTALILILSLYACVQNVTTWQEQYDLGIRYLSEGKYEEAILAFTAAIGIDPKQADAYIGLADAYMAQGNPDSALQALRDGYAATGDTRLQARIDELAAPEPTPTPEPTPESGLWKTAYIDYINGLERGGQAKYELINVDDDNIPELYIALDIVNDGFILCTCYNGSVNELGIGGVGYAGFSYMEGANLFMCGDSGSDWFYNIIYSIADGEFVEQAKEEGQAFQSEAGGPRTWEYYWNGSPVSLDEVNNLVRSIYNYQEAIDPNLYGKEDLFRSYEEIIEEISNY